MYIRKMSITEFRLFKNQEIVLGKHITAISGFNATGKSTLLALLAQCGELRGHKPIVHSSFKAELSEILKFSEEKDRAINPVGSLHFCDIGAHTDYPEVLTFRAFRQAHNDVQRYRIIPKKTPDRKTERKLSWPTLYLGLGRLYPIGESENVVAMKTRLTSDDMNFIINNAKAIMTMDDDIRDFTAMSIQETTKKRAFGFNTDEYDYLCNSAGQDNLGQILLAVLSFAQLKQELGDKWNGGLLLIDEIDATLHPSAQNRLINFLYKQSMQIGFQIVFTTHSLSLLEYLSDRTLHNSVDEANNYEVVYVTNANKRIQILQNPNFGMIYNDLMVLYDDINVRRKIPVFTEDGEARFILAALLPEHIGLLNLLDVSLGNENLIGLLTADYRNFSRYLFVLDGDVDDEKIMGYERKVSVESFRCLVKLPGEKRPEEELWDYICHMDGDHPFLIGGLSRGFSLRAITQNGPFSDRYSSFNKERDKFKKWFNDNQNLIRELLPYWIDANKESVNKFITKFIAAYNSVAKLNFLPPISKKGGS